MATPTQKTSPTTGSAGGLKQYVTRLDDPPIAKSLFGDVRWAWIWLLLRVYIGWQW